MRHNVRDKKGRFCKKSVEPVTKGYKGFKKGLIREVAEWIHQL